MSRHVICRCKSNVEFICAKKDSQKTTQKTRIQISTTQTTIVTTPVHAVYNMATSHNFILISFMRNESKQLK